MVKLLLDHEANVGASDIHQSTALHIICKTNPRYVPWYGDNPFISDGRSVMTEGPLSPGVGSSDTSGIPTYDCSANIHIVKALLDRGVDVNAAGRMKETPLHLVSLWKEKALVVELLRRGANVMLTDELGQIPLHYAVRHSDVYIVRELLLQKMAGEGINYEDYECCTPLHEACFTDTTANREGRGLPIIRLLLEHGAMTFTIRNKAGRNAFDIAHRHKYRDAVALTKE
jgi:ankyrin repeat protein